jgi:eukaryotic-like serine/threonine-protein kinase
MSSTRDQHPTHTQLAAFCQGRLSTADAEQLETHLQHCTTCCDAMSHVACDDGLARLARAVHGQGVDTETSGISTARTKVDTSDKIPASRNAPDKSVQPTPGADRVPDPDIPEELRRHPRYSVQRVLGRGGMGVVWLAEHQMMRRLVALKVIGAKFTTDRAAVERFHQEVRAAAKLTHPNIVTAYDAEQAGQLHFLVMEYVDGLSLAEHVRQHGPVSIDMACDVIRQTCSGLRHAHGHGMIHRDIKPQNLMLGHDGVVRILDFGLARLAFSDGPVSPTARTEVRLTATDMMLGTPDYMPPEQAVDPGSVDARADIYSLGCTLFFLLTGRAPFEGCSFEQLVTGGLRKRIAALRELRPDVRLPLLRLVERMTAERPEDRISSAKEVMVLLDSMLMPDRRNDQQGTPTTHPAAPPEQHNLLTNRTRSPLPHRPSKRHSTAREGPAVMPDHRPWSARRSRASRAVAGTGTRMLRWIAAASMAVLLVAGGLLAFRDGFFRTDQIRTPVPPDATLKASADNRQPPAMNPQAPPGVAAPPAARSRVGARLGHRFRILYVVPATDFYWHDVGPVSRLLTEAQCDVQIASWSAQASLLNNAGPEVKIPLLLADVDPTDFDALIIGGGPGIVRLAESCPEADEAERIIRSMIASGKPIAALSGGPIVLAKAKLLQGAIVTGHPLLVERMQSEYGIRLTGNPVEVSGRIITGRDSLADVVTRFADELLRSLQSSETPP